MLVTPHQRGGNGRVASAGEANEQGTIASIYLCELKRRGAGLHFGHVKIRLTLYYHCGDKRTLSRRPSWLEVVAHRAVQQTRTDSKSASIKVDVLDMWTRSGSNMSRVRG